MITSVHNPRVQAAKKLLRRAVRNEQREFLVEGERAVREALSARAPIETLFVDPTKSSQIRRLAEQAESVPLPVYEVSSAVMSGISGASTAPGVVGVCRFIDAEPRILLERPLSLVTILGEVRDPGNAGTIIRTCRAAGVDAVFVTAGTVDIYNPKLVRATAGALFSLPVAREVPLRWLLDELGRLGVNRVAAAPRDGTEYDRINFAKPTAFLVGNEAWGLPPEVSDCVDVTAVIPMAGLTESLNVAVASAVLLFEAARQRRAFAVRA